MSDPIFGMPKKKVPEKTEVYGIVLPIEVKKRLLELKLFYGYDVPKWVRGIIVEALNKIDKPNDTVEL